ncbi:MAG TPA: FAD-dependent monooxygenase [Vicinamibacterales bacterium]|nr:FAD-dependent monooxygenase [Vicinamibacterales bacterium]
MNALIVGGGIGGLCAAVALARAGIEVDVFERAAELQEAGAGLTLWGNALAALDSLGLGELRRMGSPLTGVVYRSDGRVLLSVSSARQAAMGGPAVALHRADLQRTLIDHLGAARLTLASPCTGVTRHASGVVAHVGGRDCPGDVLVGADGLHSVVRAQLHGARPPVYAGYTAWRGVTDWRGGDVRPGETWGRGARFGRVPIGGGRLYWFATKNVAEGRRSPDGEQAELRRTFRGWHAPIEALIEATAETAILRSDIYDRPVISRWSAGRVTLLGDAAHPMTPNLGQGACQAIEDAVALAKCLREGGPADAALRCYEQARAPRANAFVRRSRRLGRMAQWQQPAAVWLRDAVVAAAGRL